MTDQAHLAAPSGEAAPKFTPGPWAVDPELSDFDFGQPQRDGTRAQLCRYVHKPVGNGRIAQCFSNCLVTTTKELEANAHLISAAPDLYNVLKAICDQSDEFLAGDMPRAAKPQALYKRARAALAKARGE